MKVCQKRKIYKIRVNDNFFTISIIVFDLFRGLQVASLVLASLLQQNYEGSLKLKTLNQIAIIIYCAIFFLSNLDLRLGD